MAYDPALQDFVDERITEALKNRVLSLDNLPIADLSRKLEQIMQPTGDNFILPHSIGPDALAAVPQCYCWNSGNISIPNATTSYITFDSEEWKSPSSMHSTVTNPHHILAPIDGLYLVTGGVSWVSASGAGTREIWIEVPGNRSMSDANQQASLQEDRQQVVSTVRLTEGQFVRLGVFQNSGAALNVLAHTPYGLHLSVAFLSS